MSAPTLSKNMGDPKSKRSSSNLTDDDIKSPVEKEAREDIGADMHDIPEPDPEISKRVVRKFDIHLLLLLATLYLLNALDKTNLGNAKTNPGFERDLHLTGDQYYQLITAFYAPFCVFGTPISILIKKFSAARVLPIMALAFGTLSMCTAACTTFAGILVVRLLLALAEAAVLPGVVFYLSTFYQRGELASRVGIFYAAASAAGAFGGLIAYGVFQIEHASVASWQILFLVEGGATVFVAFLLWLLLPRTVSDARFLTPEEKEVALQRLMRDAVAEDKLNIKGAFRSLVHWHTVAWLFVEFCLGVPLASVSNFLPQIVARLGYGTVKTNLLTVAPNLTGALCLVALTQSSDYFRERSFHLVTALTVTLVGFIILATVDVLEHKGVCYFATFLLTAGSFSPSVLVTTWASNNTLDPSTRAVLAALVVAFGNAAGLVSSNVFRKKDEPKYELALVVTSILGGAAIVGAIAWGLYMRWDNARRNRKQGVKLTSRDVDTRNLSGGSADPSFRWLY